MMESILSCCPVGRRTATVVNRLLHTLLCAITYLTVSYGQISGADCQRTVSQDLTNHLTPPQRTIHLILLITHGSKEEERQHGPCCWCDWSELRSDDWSLLSDNGIPRSD